jgi:hypothetical protein
MRPSRLPFLLLAVVVALSVRSAEAGLIRVTAVDGNGEFAEKFVAGGMSEADSSAPVDPRDQFPSELNVAQAAHSTGSTTSTSASAGGGAAGGFVALAHNASTPPAPQPSGPLAGEGFVWIPPAFSTGVFRPPRAFSV